MSLRNESTLTPAPSGYPIKLVRDNTPAILNDTGEPGDLWYGPATGDRERWLRLKLAEEVGEYLVDGGWGELRDVLASVPGVRAYVLSTSPLKAHPMFDTYDRARRLP